MRAERGQALVEAMLALPMCVACALAIVDCGVLVRDRMALAQAATRAADAVIEGSDPRPAARGALPSSLDRRVDVQVRGDRVTVTARSRTTLIGIVHDVEQHSQAWIPGEVPA